MSNQAHDLAVQRVPVADLVPYPGNAREGDVGAICQSLTAHGQYRPLVVQRSTMHVLAGNHTLEAARQLGWSEVACTLLDVDDEQARRIVLVDNRTGDLATNNDAALAALLTELAGTAGGLEGTGFDGDDLDDLLADLEGGGADPDESSGTDTDPGEPPAEPRTQPGDVWVLGEHRLICGDAASVVERCDTVFFDPPYDAGAEVLALRWTCSDVLVFTDHRHLLDCVDGWPVEFRSAFVWDGVSSWYTPSWPLARGKFALWFGSSAYDEHGWHYGEPGEARTVTNTRGTYDYEPCPRGKHLSTVYQSPTNKEQGGHPHSKPVEWLSMLLANCTSGAVFDPFAGSGSSLIACENLGRRWTGVELDPRYCDVIVDRWERHTGRSASLERSDG